MTKRLVAYCDGASRKDGRGGWGYVILSGDKRFAHGCGGEYNTTNNRMELMAAIQVLRYLPPPAKVTIHSDSMYVIGGIQDHLDLWLKTNWRSATNKPVKNQDLWEMLGHLDCDHDVTWEWVKGHSGVPGNEEADRLAGLGVPPEIEIDFKNEPAAKTRYSRSRPKTKGA